MNSPQYISNGGPARRQSVCVKSTRTAGGGRYRVREYSQRRDFNMKALWRFEGRSLVPDSVEAEEWIGNQSQRSVEVTVTTMRSPEQHRMFFRTIHTLWNNLPDRLQAEYKSSTGMRRRMLVSMGYFTIDELGFCIPDSLAVGNMRPDEWRDFLVAYEKWVAATLGTTLEELKEGSE